VEDLSHKLSFLSALSSSAWVSGLPSEVMMIDQKHDMFCLFMANFFRLGNYLVFEIENMIQIL